MIGGFLSGRYRIDSEIAKGGMGVVYRAHDTLLERDVAIKIMHPSRYGSEGRARILREAQAAARLNHPNIVSIYDVGEVESIPYIVMELVDGIDLLRAGSMTIPQIVLLFSQLCQALGHAHNQGIVHRDLKPENVMVLNPHSSSTSFTPEESSYPEVKVKLMDFGLARSRGASRLTEQGGLVGTVFYMPPEQALGQEVDGRADLYSLGVMLYERLCGRLPFEGDNPLAIITQHLSTPPVPPSQFNVEIPPGLEVIILRLLAKRPEERFQTANELGLALAHLEMPGLFTGVAVAPSTNLPAQLTSFVGRERETEAIKRLLSSSRLVTLTGIGGCGKTRLALHVVGEMLPEYPDGVWLVELATLTDPPQVSRQVLSALGLGEETGKSTPESLLQHLRKRKNLLVFDNCEHLITTCASLIQALLLGCPDLHVLATSREALGIAGESIYAVPSLSVPDVAWLARQKEQVHAISQSEAVQLFVARARQSQPDFELTEANALSVAQICYRLDGIPLAIELVTARLRTLGLEQVVARLDDRFRLLTGGSRTALPRHQTLQASIDWSYDLLASEERSLLLRLPVFTGGWTLEAAEAVCAGDEIEPGAVLDLLAHLADKSLVFVEEEGGRARYYMLETIRQYTREKVTSSEDVRRLRQRHLDYFAHLAEEVEEKLSGKDSAHWHQLLEAELDNFRLALTWALENRIEEGEVALRMVGPLWILWHSCGFLKEGQEWMGRALEADIRRSKARAKALTSIGILTWQQGNYALARKYMDESIALWRDLGPAEKIGLCEAEHMMGHLVFDQKDYATARDMFSECLGCYQEREDSYQVGTLVSDLGMVEYHLGNLSSACTFYESSMAVFRELENREGVASNLGRLADIARLEEDYDRAAEMYEESLKAFQELGDKLEVASFLHKLGYIAQYRGELEKAHSLFWESLSMQREIGNKQGMIEGLSGLAGLAVARRKLQAAVRFFAAAQSALDAAGMPLAPADRFEFERDLATARANLEEEAFATAWSGGGALSLEVAVAEALGAG